jgi:hypothetical protein
MGLTVYNTMAATAAFITLPALVYFLSEDHPYNPDCLSSPCPDIIEGNHHSREIKALNESSAFDATFYESYFSGIKKDQEYLRFRKDDSREKFLYLSMEEDFNGASDPKHMPKFLSDINKKYDLKYKVIKSYDEICQEVEQASKIGKLGNVLIQGHGSRAGIHISGPSHIWDNYIHEDREFLNCFRGLDPSGKITILSSDTGVSKNGSSKESLAQKIATAAKRAVISAIDRTFAGHTEMPNLDDFEVFHADSKSATFFFKGKNTFKIFHPIYENCINFFKDRIHAREQMAVETIKKETIGKSTLIQPTEFDDLQDVLRLCKDDPRQKFLYLSMESDAEGQYALSPERNPEVFEKLSKNYDFKFKVISSYDELCQEVKESTKTGKLLNLVINGHGNPNGIHLSGENIWDNYVHKNRDLAKCFNSLDPSAKITLFVCSAGKPQNGNPNDNIAGEIMKNTQNMVVASTELSYSDRRRIVSIDPFEITHPSEKDPKSNIYKEFNPKKI